MTRIEISYIANDVQGEQMYFDTMFKPTAIMDILRVLHEINEYRKLTFKLGIKELLQKFESVAKTRQLFIL